MNAVLSFLLDNAPWLALIVIVGFVAWRLSWRLSKYHSSLEETKKRINELPCTNHGDALTSVSSRLGILDTIGEQVQEISKWVMKFDPNAIDVLVRKHSPRVMTEIGRSLFINSGASSVLEENLDSFITKLEALNPQTPFDVEDRSLSVLLGSISDPIFNSIKNYIYYGPESVRMKDENGHEVEVKLSLLSIIRLMGLELRDKYLERHPEVVPRKDNK